MNHTNQLKKGAIISYIGIFLNIAAGLIYIPWMVRQIGISDYGLFSLILAFLSYFLMDFGLGVAISRFVVNARAKGNDEEIEKLISTTTRIYLIIDLLIAIALIITFLFLSNIFPNFSDATMHKFKIIYCIAGLFSILSFPFLPQDGILVAYEKFVVFKTTNLIQKLGIVFLTIIALLCGYGLYTLVLINGLAGFGIALYKFWYINHHTIIKIKFNYFDKSLAKSMFQFSIWIFIMGIAQRLLLNIAPTILGVFSNTTQIAIFSIGMSLEGYTWTFANSLNGLFMPMVAKLSIENQTRTQINELMIRIGRIQLLIIGLIFTGIVVLGKSFINLWIGSKFGSSYIVALCLIGPGMITLTQEIACSLLYIENKVKYRAILFISASFVSVIIGCLLAPNYGATGVAYGVLAALIICHVIGMNIIYNKILKLDILTFLKECHLKMIFPMIISVIISLILQYFLPITSWVELIIQTIIFVIIFYTLMWFISMNNYEKSLIRNLSTKIIGR